MKLNEPGPIHRTTRITLSLLLVLSQPMWAATIVVDETTCTLGDAVTAANTDSAVGGCPAGSGADTIELTTDVTLTEVATVDCGPPCFNGDTGLPEVVSEIFLVGGGFTIERAAGAPLFRLFLVSGTLSLSDVVLTNGDADYYYYYYDAQYGVGGAIANTGTVTLTDTLITNNRPNGISNRGGALTLTNSTVSNNGPVYNCPWFWCTTNGLFPYSGGGGIYSSQGSLSLTDSVVSGNRAGRGGGIAVVDGQLSLTTSAMSGNSAYQESAWGLAAGGGLMAQSATVSLTDSTMTDNSVIFGPVCFGEFGCSASGDALGGAIRLIGGSLIVTNGTLSGNQAFGSGLQWPGYPLPTTSWETGKGGAIMNTGGSLDLINSTVSGNVANLTGGGISGAGVVTNSIIADSDGGNCNGGLITDSGSNFADDGSCGGGFAAITPGVDFDTTLADNGGPTQTHALLPGSSAIDAVGDCGLETDQRGLLRWDGACDSGSFEYGATSADADQDGVLDSVDICLGTTIPESVPTKRLGVNRWALVDEDGVFDTTPPPGGGGGPEFEFAVADTGGCSCEQIIESLALGWGHTKFGCSSGAMLQWTAMVGGLNLARPEVEAGNSSPGSIQTMMEGTDSPSSFTQSRSEEANSPREQSPRRTRRESRNE